MNFFLIIKMDENISKKTKSQLIEFCKERKIKYYSGKNKEQIINLIQNSMNCLNTKESKIICECQIL